MEITKVLGLEIPQIQQMIDFLIQQGFNPYNWDEFKEATELKVMIRLR